MPRTTHAYGFEMKVAGFAGELCARFTAGESPRPFILELDRGGSVTSLSFDDGSGEWGGRAKRRPGGSYLLYDPLDEGKEYIWVSWEGIEQSVMERLSGQQFEQADFVPLPHFARRARALKPEGQFPPSWGVMF
jgi:hypothetical protein